MKPRSQAEAEKYSPRFPIFFSTKAEKCLRDGEDFFLLIVSFALIYIRKDHLKSAKKIESFASREGGFLLNNVIFVVLCFAVFWGTIFPVVSEAVRGTKITVGAPFFNQINTRRQLI